MAETCLDDGRCWGTSSGRGEREWDGALVWRHATSDVPKSAAAASHTYPMLHTQNSYIYIYTCICTHHPHTHTGRIHKYRREREREECLSPHLSTPHIYRSTVAILFSYFLFCLSWFLSSFSERYVIRNRLSVIARLTTARQSQQLETFCFFSTRLAAVALFLELFSICGRDYTSEIVRGGRNQPTYREFVSDDGRAQGEWVYRLG